MKKRIWLYGFLVVALVVSWAAWNNIARVEAQASKQAQKAPAKAPIPKAKAKATPACENYTGTDPTVTVTITPVSGKLEVDPFTVCLTKQQEIEWEWKGDPSKSWSVVFGDTPFAKGYFHNKNPKSGKPTKGQGGRSYKYAVAAEDFPVVDPDVIIKK